MSIYAPNAFSIYCGIQAGYVIQTCTVAVATGAAAISQYWNFTSGVFEPAPFDPTKHLKPFTRVSADGTGADAALQIASFPVDALADRTAFATTYTIASSGDRADLLKIYPPKAIRDEVGFML